MQIITLQRSNLSDEAEGALRAMIVDGRLGDGERLNEVHLSASLGVSRTPLREALNRLAHEGAVEARPRIGYFVKPLTEAEFEQIYEIRPILDPAALRLAGLPDERQIARLATLNAKLAAARDPAAAIDLDDEWHRLLLAHCPNRVLLELIDNAILRTRRYELALMRETSAVANARADHELIIAALRARDLDGACQALEQNMRSGRGAIVAWLQAREKRKRG